MAKKILEAVIVAAVICASFTKGYEKKQVAEAVALPLINAEVPSAGNIRLNIQCNRNNRTVECYVMYYPKAAGDITIGQCESG